MYESQLKILPFQPEKIVDLEERLEEPPITISHFSILSAKGESFPKVSLNPLVDIAEIVVIEDDEPRRRSRKTDKNNDAIVKVKDVLGASKFLESIRHYLAAYYDVQSSLGEELISRVLDSRGQLKINGSYVDVLPGVEVLVEEGEIISLAGIGKVRFLPIVNGAIPIKTEDLSLYSYILKNNIFYIRRFTFGGLNYYAVVCRLFNQSFSNKLECSIHDVLVASRIPVSKRLKS